MFGKNEDQTDIYEFLGEGMPYPLSLFYLNDSSGQGLKNLRLTYDNKRSESEKLNLKSSYLLQINKQVDLRTLQLQNVAIKDKKLVLDRAEHGVWSGTQNEIDDRVELFKYAISESNNPELIAYALLKATLQMRVSAIVPVVAAALDASLSRVIWGKGFYNESEILKNAVNAATVQLFEAHKTQFAIAKARQQFGTVDISRIHKDRAGQITAEEAKTLNDLSDVQSQNAGRSYTSSDLVDLRSVLERVKNFPDFPILQNGREIATSIRALKDYPNPHTCNLLLDKSNI